MHFFENSMEVKMFKKFTILAILTIISTSSFALADKGGGGEGGGEGGGWGGGEIRENFGNPGQDFRPNIVPPVQPILNTPRQFVQPTQQQIKRNYNQNARKAKHAFQQSWKRAKKVTK